MYLHKLQNQNQGNKDDRSHFNNLRRKKKFRSKYVTRYLIIA